MTLGEASNEHGSRAGEAQVIAGESGVGKTWVLRAIAGLWRSCRSRIVGTQFEWPELLTSALAPRQAGPVLKSQTRRTSMRTSKAFVLGAIMGDAGAGGAPSEIPNRGGFRGDGEKLWPGDDHGGRRRVAVGPANWGVREGED